MLCVPRPIIEEVVVTAHNDSTGRYNEAAAELAWSRTIEFFRQHLAASTAPNDLSG